MKTKKAWGASNLVSQVFQPIKKLSLVSVLLSFFHLNNMASPEGETLPSIPGCDTIIDLVYVCIHALLQGYTHQIIVCLKETN